MIVQSERSQKHATREHKEDEYWLRAVAREWQARGRPYSLRAFSTNLISNLGEGTRDDPDNLLLAVLPELAVPPSASLTCGYALKYNFHREWMSIIQATGFLALEHRFWPPRAFSGRSLLPPSQVDWRFVRSWIEYCDANHGAGCGTSSASMPIGLKLKVIDCRIRAIVELPTGQQYVALSYVWGHNIQGYPSRDSDNLSEQCPAVIEDAIQATLQLNQRFLWVIATVLTNRMRRKSTIKLLTWTPFTLMRISRSLRPQETGWRVDFRGSMQLCESLSLACALVKKLSYLLYRLHLMRSTGRSGQHGGGLFRRLCCLGGELCSWNIKSISNAMQCTVSRVFIFLQTDLTWQRLCVMIQDSFTRKNFLYQVFPMLGKLTCPHPSRTV
jgi:hypothetical protein